MSDIKGKRIKESTRLIWLCWLIYACSYLGKVNYAANINSIISFYRVDHSTAGLATTFFFFAYAVGQIINGLLCRKYNLKWVIFISLIVSGLINFIVACSTAFAPLKYLWLVNGFAMSILWPGLIRTLSENISKQDMARASVLMGTTVASGTFLIYALSALFVRINFKIIYVIIHKIIINSCCEKKQHGGET